MVGLINYRRINAICDAFTYPTTIENIIKERIESDETNYKEVAFYESFIDELKKCYYIEDNFHSEVYHQGTALIELTKTLIYLVLEDSFIYGYVERDQTNDMQWTMCVLNFDQIIEYKFDISDQHEEEDRFENGIAHYNILLPSENEQRGIIRNINPKTFQVIIDLLEEYDVNKPLVKED